jgi:hypothetical protein
MAETPKPMQGTWTLTAPDGRTWQADSPLRVVAAESRERIPATVALERIYAAASEDHDWLPIHEAPKDGTRVILSWGGKSINGFYLDNSKTATPWAGWRVESMVPQPAGQPTHYQPFPAPKDYAVERKASEVEAARASLPAPTDAEWMKEAALKINRLILLSGAKIRSEGDPPEDRITDADIDRLESELLAHLRARPAEPTPSVDVLRQCLEALEGVTEILAWMLGANLVLPDAGSPAAKAEAAIDAARQALEKP